MEVDIQKQSRVDILRGLVIDKMTAAMQEILAVVEATVTGYEAELLLLKRELSHGRRKQQDAVLQPQVYLHRADPSTEEWKLECKDLKDCGASDKCTEEHEADVFHEEMLLDHEESDCSLADLPSDCAVSCPANRGEGGLGADTINDSQKVKRRGRYKSDHKVTDRDSENERTPSQKKQRKRPLIKLRIGLLKNSPDTDPSNNALPLDEPVEMILCQQNLSESDFINLLRSTFPELRENKPFEAYLADSSTGSHLQNRMTATELYATFQSLKQQQFDFYIQLKGHEETCETPLLNDERPTTEDLDEEAPSEMGDTSELTDEKDGASSVDSPDQSEDDNDSESEYEEFSPAPKKRRRKKRRTQKPNCVSCKVCGQLFNSETILTKHALSHVDNPDKSLCGVCGLQLESPEELKSHLETHQKLHQCDTCGRYFLSFYTCKKHMMEKKCVREKDTDTSQKGHKLNQDKRYRCDMCPQLFKYKAQLGVHYRKHTGEGKCSCDVCGKCLVDYRSLCRHRLTHTGQKNFGCKTCGMMFTTNQGLKSHEKTHSAREKTFLCDVCSKSFYTNALLLLHQKRHDDSFNVKCPVCDKTLKGGLMVHMKIHTGEKPFSCSECGRKFGTRKCLRQHMNSHLGVRPFTCTVCGYTCRRKGHLKEHTRIHSGHKPYKCSLCDKAFSQSHCLKTHMKTHQTEEQSAGAEQEEGALVRPI
uniref:C2H2-type domain-containing protein n=1 Tax=Neogobius melanostomus TaxID=47308 RepID=A0A8C6TJA0_9GOBI